MTRARAVGNAVGLFIGNMLKGFLYGAGAWVALQVLSSLSGGTVLLCFGNGCP
jgi:hypothetical protein